jgi:AAA+ ATPase superfamily predicted ATPase
MSMRLAFIDRERELERLRRTVRRRETTLQCVYGRRRAGKSRLLAEAFRSGPLIYFVAARQPGIRQREALAREIARLVPRFAEVRYPVWDALFERLVVEAPARTVVVLDEFPWLAAASPELPSVLQRQLDEPRGRPIHFVIAGSSQRMMMGFVLDAAEPLYGRASQILKLEPLALPFAREAFVGATAEQLVERYAVWGGIPRYWEEAVEHDDPWRAIGELVLDKNGVFHREPERLLLDEFRQAQQADAILSLVGQGCHRPSEIAGRLQRAASSLSGPLAQLVELGLLRRELPFGATSRASKLALYDLADPLLRFWYRFVDPNRSLLERELVGEVLAQVQAAWDRYLGSAWETIARDLVPTVAIAGERFGPAARWWGRRERGSAAELDLVAESLADSRRVLVGEVKLSCSAPEAERLRRELSRKIESCPPLRGKVPLLTVWALRAPRARGRPWLITPRTLLRVRG